jgi:hypothetical protein
MGHWSDDVIDIADALDLLESCVRDRGEGYRSPRRHLSAVSPSGRNDVSLAATDSIVTLALRKAGVPLMALPPLAHTPVAEVYASGHPCLNLTLGAVVVFRAAESEEWRGQTWVMAFQAALRAASRFVELIPDTVAGSAAEAVDASRRGAPPPQYGECGARRLSGA